MRKHIISFLALILVAQMAWATTITTPTQIPAYYADADGFMRIEDGAGEALPFD